MSVTSRTIKTGKFTEWLAIAALGSSLFMFLVILISPFFIRRVIDQAITVSPDQLYKFPPVEVEQSGVGAFRVDADARISTGEWVAFDIQLLDASGKVIASGTKQGWSESGTWYEEGESGSWSESDTLGGLDVRNKQKEKITVAIALRDHGTTTGAELNTPVAFQVLVENGVVDIGALWFGAIGSLILAIVSVLMVGSSGKKVIAEKIADSDPTGRGTMGGANSLVRMKVDFDADEGALTLSNMQINLFINNSYGEQIYSELIPVKINVHKNDGKFVKATGKVERFFLFPEQNSYGFHVEVKPDEPIDRTRLTVRDRARTLGTVEVIEITTAA